MEELIKLTGYDCDNKIVEVREFLATHDIEDLELHAREMLTQLGGRVGGDTRRCCSVVRTIVYKNP